MRYQVKNLELDLFPEEVKMEQDYSATFADNMSLPVHKWYRYTAGFSATWVSQLIKHEKANGRTKVIDPFAGSGTVLLESEFENVQSIGIEAHPYIYRIAKTKLDWNYSPELFKEGALSLLQEAKKMEVSKTEYPKLIATCYPPEVIQKLEALKQTWLKKEQDE